MTVHPVLAGAVAQLPRSVRLHMVGRARSFPLDALCAEVPVAGRILEIGCGHGLVAATLALQSADRRVVGYDIDPEKIRWAEVVAAAIRSAGRSMAVELAADPDTDRLAPGSWDAVVVADVAYLLAPAAQVELLATAAAALAPGGVLVLKELDDRPRAKFAFARAEEVVATRVLRVTAGSHLHWRSAQDWARLLEAAGLTVTTRRIDRGYPYPHVLVVGRRPAQAAPPDTSTLSPLT